MSPSNTCCQGDSEGKADVNGVLPAQNTPQARTMPVAIVGMSCQFSGEATSASKLWDMCAAGRDGWSPIPPERFESVAAKDLPDGGYFLQKKDLSRFDAAFFNFPADQASVMDPQIRLMLESVYEAAEEGGIPIERLAGTRTSVFAGVYAKDFYDLQMRDPETLPVSFITGNGTAMLSNRISHFYDFQGPSMTIDTGCSSGLTSVHQACQSLYSGEADVSVVTAAEVMLNRDMLVLMKHQGVLGQEGKCFAWDERAHGYGRGEGVGTLVLKPLDAALRDGNNVHAVIRQIGLNQDGKTTTITSPSMEAQRKLIQECYERAGLDISETAYVEAHMTGTFVGDPIEAEAIAQTFGKSRIRGDPIIVGSVKTNVGHTEPVSGIAAIIKTAYALKNRTIAPNLNFRSNNPNIPVEEWNVMVPTEVTPWPSDKPLRASVNNFGYGGANAHAILEDVSLYTEASVANAKLENGFGSGHDAPRVFLVSARDATAAQGLTENLATYIREELAGGKAASDLETLAYTLSERRSRLPVVAAVKANNLTELADKLEQLKTFNKPAHSTKQPRLGFVFNGQGAQWHAMGRELIAHYPIFKDAMNKADQVLKDFGARWSLCEELQRDDKSTRVHETNISQPINVALQLCLVELLKSWGITPSAVTSHSSGEIAAGYSAGFLSFKEALGVVYYRGELAAEFQKRLSLRGGMLAAGLGAEQANKYLRDVPEVVVACVNSADSVTLSGDIEALDQVAAILESDGIFARKLKVPLAYHSQHMQHMAERYTGALSVVLSRTGALPTEAPTFASPVTGQLLNSPEEVLRDPEHWVRNLTSPVLFSDAFESMCFSDSNRAVDIILEIGAHSTLSGPIRSILGTRTLPYITCLKRNVDAVSTMQDAACELLRQAYPVALRGVNRYDEGAQYPYLKDLPSYPWNHTTSYWTEPRSSREARFSKTRPHELIGTRLSGGDGFTFAWRNFLRVSEIDWLTDHRVESRVVLPGAAYVAMALEAVRQLVDSSEQMIRGYKLRNVDIMNALTIPETTTGIETMLCLRPCSEKELDHKGWYDFEISSVGGSSDTWSMHCKGGVAVEMTNATKAATTTIEYAPNEETFLPTDSKVRNIEISSFFEILRGMGFYHGPMFQNFEDSKAAGRRAITNMKVTRAAKAELDYVLHPATLDSIIQAAYIDMAEEQQQSGDMVLPRAIKTMFVPAKLNRRANEKLQALTQLIKTDKRGSTTDITVINAEGNNMSSTDYLQVKGFYVQAVARESKDSVKGPQVCFKSQWELDPTWGIPASVTEAMPVAISEEDTERMTKCLKVSFFYICDALAALENDQNSENWAWHHKRFVTWMKDVVAQGNRGEFGPGSRAWTKASKGVKQMLMDELSRGSPAVRLLCRVGSKLPEIVRGDITPLELMMADNLLNEYYMDVPEFQRLYKHITQIVDIYAVKNPGARVLEIGGGTGGATGAVLEGFASRGDGSGTLLGHYTFTDVSSGFFEAARQKFAGWTALMDFNKLDIEQDPAEQGFELGIYDMVVASAVLHATKSLAKTLANVRKLLKPGGKLILLEQTKDRLEVQIVFGTTPGWWLGEESYRQSSPIASLDAWNGALKEVGFSGVDLEVPDLLDQQFQSSSVIVSTNTAAETTTNTKLPKRISIVYTSQPPTEWIEKVSTALLTETGVQPQLQSLEDAKIEDAMCIFVGEMGSTFLSTMDSAAFEKIRNLLVTSHGILWLSSSVSISKEYEQPMHAQADGLLRTLRNEDSTQRCVHLNFDTAPWTDAQIPFITRVVCQNFDTTRPVSEVEGEYKVIDGTLRVSRMYPDADADNEAGKSFIAPPAELQPFDQAGRVLEWQSARSGVLSDAYFTDDFRYSLGLKSGMIEVEPKAFGLNFRDVMVALGQVEEDGLVYSEMCGVVKTLGPDTEMSGLKIGDRVCGAGWGYVTNRVYTAWGDVAKIPDNLSFEETASVPTIYITVYHSLVNIARLQKGETVLIHAGTGGVGQAAIMLARHIGATIYVTCSSTEKRDFLIERYNIDPSHIFSSRDASFAAAIMAATNGKGVDVLLNCLAGPLLKAGWECMARFGRFIEIGKVDMQNGRSLDMTAFRRCVTISGVDILSLAAYSKEVYRGALEATLKLISEGAVKTVYPLHVYGVSEMEKPLRQLQGGKHIGKFVIAPKPGELVKVVNRQKTVNLARDDATYLIIGGVTGIGRAVAEWMVQKGARNILIVSRNAETHQDAPSVIQACNKGGCNAVVRNCDVADEKSFLDLLEACKSTLPPIRGVLTTAMVLDDTVLERMTFDQWQHAVQPKVASTMNLHKHLLDLDFFIMMSSTAGIFGNPSQANYNAGNAFQDELARYRTLRGRPAVSIDLGIVEDVGFVAEASEEKKQILETALRRRGVGAPLALDHLLRLVECAIREPLRSTPDKSQVVTCLAGWDETEEDSALHRDRRFGTLRLGVAFKTAGVASDGKGEENINSSFALTQKLSSPEVGGVAGASRVIADALVGKMAELFNLLSTEIDQAMPMSHYGVDSLVAVEVRNWLGTAAKTKVSVFEILQTPSLQEFAALAAGRSELLVTV